MNKFTIKGQPVSVNKDLKFYEYLHDLIPTLPKDLSYGQVILDIYHIEKIGNGFFDVENLAYAPILAIESVIGRSLDEVLIRGHFVDNIKYAKVEVQVDENLW
tara:strand:- start:1110 stop:1418 length:309 start_codon:yes stop_codon:yes gene_type:complete